MYPSFQTCSPDTTLEECERLCRINQIKELCGCAPITFNKTYASDTFANCTFNQYKNCSKNLENENKTCTSSCVPYCEKWYYNVEMTSQEGQPTEQQLDMVMNVFDYLIVEETYKWTFETFIGALGGIMGIWLGLDFGTLVAFVFNPIMALIRKQLSKKDTITVSLQLKGLDHRWAQLSVGRGLIEGRYQPS